jgi:hypothetical protein
MCFLAANAYGVERRTARQHKRNQQQLVTIRSIIKKQCREGFRMSFFGRLLGFTRQPAPASRPNSQMATMQSTMNANSSGGTRRELLRVVLRDTMTRHGIPSAWIAGEVLASSSRNGTLKGVHWRLVVKHWDPRLLTHGVAFQQALIKRVTTFDPLASGWLTGISWQFDLPDESLCPAMPHPGVWTAEPSTRPVEPHAVVLPGGSGDVIAGPVRISDPAVAHVQKEDSAKADLEQLFAVRDADFRKHADGSTEPMWLGTEPAGLGPR